MNNLVYEPYYKAVLIDCGRGFFPADQIMTITKAMAECDYRYLILGFGNDGLRFLLNDMSLEADGMVYEDSTIRAAVIAENDSLAPNARGQWSQAEMDAMVDFAGRQGIEIIPMIDNPGHASSITQAMIACGLTDALLPNRNGSRDTGSRSYDIKNKKAVAWARALLRKYIAYFAGKGCHNFNLAMDEYAGCSAGWASLSEEEKEAMVSYTRQVCDDVLSADMNPIAFCDVIGHADSLPEELIGINWNSGYLKGHRNLNANYNWYYVLGAKGDPSWCGYEKSLRCAASLPADLPVTEGEWQALMQGNVAYQANPLDPACRIAPEASGAGCVFAVWNDDYLPSEAYTGEILDILRKLAESNPRYFHI